MKLVDILARELKVWPEGIRFLTQSNVDREIYDALDGEPDSSVNSLNPRFDTTKRHSQEREAYPIVTRAQWQAAVEALKAEECAHSYANKLGCPECGEDFTPAWTGEGLPPVGTVCEVDYCESWQRCEVVAHFRQRCGMVAAFTVDLVDGAKSLDAFGSESFRPIRTPEQIAAEEREK